MTIGSSTFGITGVKISLCIISFSTTSVSRIVGPESRFKPLFGLANKNLTLLFSR